MCILFIENGYIFSHEVVELIKTQSAVGMHKRATFIYDESVMREMFLASVDADDILLLSDKFDKSECDAHHLKSKCHALRYAETISEPSSVRGEYYFWFKNSEPLAKEMIQIISNIQLNNYGTGELQQMKTTDHTHAVITLLQHLQQKHDDTMNDPIDHDQESSNEAHGVFNLSDYNPLIMHATTFCKDYVLCIVYLLGGNEARSRLCVIQDGTRSDMSVASLYSIDISNNDICKLYNTLNICSRVLNINWLQSAPYGPVSIEQFALQISPPIWPVTLHMVSFVSYISPSAYLTAEHAPHGRVATVSVANMDSLPLEKRRMFYNYAIYFPEDLRAAIYLRFKDSQIVQMLSARLERICDKHMPARRNDATARDYERGAAKIKCVTFEDLRVRVFFDRGVFNARFHEDSADNEKSVYDALQELIDIYRNVHWLGVNIFHDDISAVFPRVMARFGYKSEQYNFTIGPLYISVLVHMIKAQIRNIIFFNKDMENAMPQMTQTYTLYTQQALQSKFFMARENLRLALSMTHRSVHEYINFMHHNANATDDAKKYVCIAILHSGRYGCNICQNAYSHVTQSIHTDSSVSHLQQDVNMLLKDMSQLSNCTLDVKECDSVSRNVDEHTTANEHIRKELCAACANRDMIQLTAHEQRDIEPAAHDMRMFNYSGSFNMPVDHLHADDIQQRRNMQRNGADVFTTTSVYTYTQ